MIHEGSAHATSTSTVQASAVVVRGSLSWNYLYIVLGITITSVGTILTMMPARYLPFPLNVFAFVVLVADLIWLIICNGWGCQDHLLRLEHWYENRLR